MVGKREAKTKAAWGRKRPWAEARTQDTRKKPNIGIEPLCRGCRTIQKWEAAKGLWGKEWHPCFDLTWSHDQTDVVLKGKQVSLQWRGEGTISRQGAPTDIQCAPVLCPVLKGPHVPHKFQAAHAGPPSLSTNTISHGTLKELNMTLW